MKLSTVFALSLFGLSACSVEQGGRVTTTVMREDMNELEREPVPGTVNDVWVEGMVDTIRVPGQLDPHGVYYRKPHNALVEIRPGRYQLVEYPDDRTEVQELKEK